MFFSFLGLLRASFSPFLGHLPILGSVYFYHIFANLSIFVENTEDCKCVAGYMRNMFADSYKSDTLMIVTVLNLKGVGVLKVKRLLYISRRREAWSTTTTRRGRIVAECACLESKYTARYRGFESLPLRQSFARWRVAGCECFISRRFNEEYTCTNYP